MTDKKIKQNCFHCLVRFKKSAAVSHVGSNPDHFCSKTDLLCCVMPVSVFDKHPHHSLKHYSEEVKVLFWWLPLQSCYTVEIFRKNIAQHSLYLLICESPFWDCEIKTNHSCKVEHVPVEVLI